MKPPGHKFRSDFCSISDFTRILLLNFVIFLCPLLFGLFSFCKFSLLQACLLIIFGFCKCCSGLGEQFLSLEISRLRNFSNLWNFAGYEIS